MVAALMLVAWHGIHCCNNLTRSFVLPIYSQLQFILQGITTIITISLPIGLGRGRHDCGGGEICLVLLQRRLAIVVVDGTGKYIGQYRSHRCRVGIEKGQGTTTIANAHRGRKLNQ